VSDGVLYVGTNSVPPYHFSALNASTGAKLWSRTVDGSECCAGVKGTPSVAGGVVYVGTVGGTLYAFDANTGKLRWTFQTGGGMYWSSPAVANGVLYTGSADDVFHALDARTGTELWSYTMGGATNGAPAIADGVAYMESFDHNLYAFALPP
jgi:outer membrane protein assembly factor BamB